MLTACQLLCLGQCLYIAVGFWRSLNGHTVNSGYCTCMLSWSHQWQVRHTARHHTTQGPWPFLQSYSSPWANSQGPVLPGPNSWGLFSITVVLPFIGFHINGLVQCVIFVPGFFHSSTFETWSCPHELVVDPCWQLSQLGFYCCDQTPWAQQLFKDNISLRGLTDSEVLSLLFGFTEGFR